MKRAVSCIARIALVITCAAACGPAITGGERATDVVTLADAPIPFDDIGYAASIDRVLAPARRHGLKLIDPATLDVTTVEGDADSAAAGGGFLFVLDRSGELRVIDEDTLEVTDTFATGGDYVRYVSSQNEVWVTDPGDGRVMVLALDEDGGTLTLKSPIALVGGPEGLAVDEERGIAVSHFFGGDVALLDTGRHDVERQTSTGCLGAHGVPALDVERGFAFFGCRDAELVSVGLDDGAQRGRYHLGGGGESLMAYDPASHKAFVRGDPGEVIAIVDVGEDGSLSEAGSLTASERGHCLLTAAGSLWACDETGGGLLRFDIEE
jgi:hypothetical protein